MKVDAASSPRPHEDKESEETVTRSVVPDSVSEDGTAINFGAYVIEKETQFWN